MFWPSKNKVSKRTAGPDFPVKYHLFEPSKRQELQDRRG